MLTGRANPMSTLELTFQLTLGLWIVSAPI
jgi:hypothetical protein